MLESLRSFVGGWVAKVLLGLLVLSFAVWGIQGSILGGAGSGVAQVGETVVQPREYFSAYQRALNAVQARTGSRLNREQARLFGVERQALGEVTAYATLDEFAREQGLGLSDDTLARLINENEAFRDSTGQFNRDAFRRAVYEAQMRESDFIVLQNKSAVRAQLTEAIAAGDILPSAFDKAMLEYATTERDFAYFNVTPAIAGEPPAPSEEQIAAYFEANKQAYAAPEYRELAILTLTPEAAARPDEVSDEDVKADYEARINAYRTPERRQVQQLVFPDREKAEAAAKALGEGALFETVVTQAGRRIGDTDIGLLDRGTLQARSNAAVTDAAFSLDLNATSDVVDGPFGPVILRVTEVRPEAVRSLDEVKDEIRREIAVRRAAEAIERQQEAIEDVRAGGASLQEAASQQGLTIRTVEAIDRSARDKDGTVLTDLPNSAALIRTAFETPVGGQAAPLDTGSAGYVWVETLGIEEARERTLDEVRERIIADWTAAEQAKLIDARAEALKARIEEGETLQAVAADVGAEAGSTGFLQRTGQNRFFPQNAVQSGFSVGPNGVFIAQAPNPPVKIVGQVREVKAPSQEALAQAIRERAQSGAADDLVNQMIANLQSRYAVTQNPALIEQTLTYGGR